MFNLRFLAWLALPVLLSGGATASAAPRPHQVEDKTVGFANPELLLTTEWLAKHSKDKGVVVLDARSAKDFEAGHVPGALSLPTSATYDPKARGNIGPAKQIASLLGEHGITISSHVVIYDGGRSTAAARVFWTLEVFGHKKVSVLDGGLAKWSHEKRATSTDSAQVKPVEYKIGSPNERCSDMDQLLEDVENPDVIMLDARSKGEFDKGRIPASVRIEWMQNYTSDDIPVFKSAKDLFKLYEDQGVTPDKRVHAY